MSKKKKGLKKRWRFSNVILYGWVIAVAIGIPLTIHNKNEKVKFGKAKKPPEYSKTESKVRFKIPPKPNEKKVKASNSSTKRGRSFEKSTPIKVVPKLSWEEQTKGFLKQREPKEKQRERKVEGHWWNDSSSSLPKKAQSIILAKDFKNNAEYIVHHFPGGDLYVPARGEGRALVFCQKRTFACG